MIKTAIIGVGNCSCSLVQAVFAAKGNKLGLGVAFNTIGGYHTRDIEFTAAFDIDPRKVGKKLSEAIFSEPNCTTKYFDIPEIDVEVSLGKLLDGVSDAMKDIVEIDSRSSMVVQQDVVSKLKDTKTEVVISYLPVGSEEAAEFYAEAAAKAGCAFINCMPASIATSTKFAEMFKRNNLPVLGDDIKSQVGSTAIHRSLISVLQSKGVQIDRTYQLNIGGNTDFKNMRDPNRSKGKKYTKEISLKHLFNNETELGVGPSDYVPFLKDHKVGYIYIEGQGLLGMPFTVEMKLKVEDSPNSAGVAINAIRAAKTALDRNIAGVVNNVCPYLFKNPPIATNEKETFEDFTLFAEDSIGQSKDAENEQYSYKQASGH